MESSLNLLDIALLVLLIPGAIAGLFSGFVKQVAKLAALIVGIWGGWRFSALLSGLIATIFKVESPLLTIISFAIIFIALLWIVNLVGRAVSGLVKFVLLGWLDRVLGAIFSTLKYALILSLFFFFFNSANSRLHIIPDHHMENSSLYKLIEPLAPSLLPHVKNVNL